MIPLEGCFGGLPDVEPPGVSAWHFREGASKLEGEGSTMTEKTAEKEWFLEDISREEFQKLPPEERFAKLSENDLKGLSGDALKARVDELSEKTETFIKEVRLSRLAEKK